jgi:ketosteroid isomerase-like protein
VDAESLIFFKIPDIMTFSQSFSLFILTKFLVGSILFTQSFSFQVNPHGLTKGAKNIRCEQNSICSALKSNSFDDTDPVVRLPLMEAELASIIDAGSKGDDETGGLSTTGLRQDELEEEIDNAKTAAEFGVRRAQMQFYDAFSNQDIDAMKSVWSDDDTSVRCIHPGMEAISGKDAIVRSWAQVFQGDAFEIEPAKVKIEICGKTAMCSCIEQTPNGGKLEALNVYRREDGHWCMTLHMASPIIMSMM